MATLDSNGVRIHYEVFGEGKPLVLVHGIASSLHGTWVATRWIEALTPIRKVIALDCRGHGESDKPHDTEHYAGDAMQNDVIRLIDHLGIETTDLFGYSMGAGISLRLLLQRPERFTSVVLGGIGDVRMLARGRPNVAAALLAADASTITDAVGKGFRIFAEAGKNDLTALAAYQQAPRTAVGQEELKRVPLPVLIVIGQEDALVGSPDELAEAIAGARLVKIPDREHLTVVPDPRFKEVVLEFLQEASPA